MTETQNQIKQIDLVLEDLMSKRSRMRKEDETSPTEENVAMTTDNSKFKFYALLTGFSKESI